MIEDRASRLGMALAVLQVFDAAGNAVAPRRYLDDHFAHLGVSAGLRRLLQPIKVGSSAALLLGARWPRVRVTTAAGLVAYYAAAARFHLLAGDHPVVAAPAAGLGAIAALVVLGSGPRRP